MNQNNVIATVVGLLAGAAATYVVMQNKDKIIEKLLAGDSSRDIEAWIKTKYPGKPRLHVSYSSLSAFRKNYLEMDADTVNVIKALKNNANTAAIKNKIMTSSAYQQKLDEIVSNDIDVTRKMLEMEKLISSRIEYYFNLISDTSDPNKTFGIKEERMFVDLLKSQQEVLRDWKKFVEGVADKKVEHNINISVVNEQVNILKRIVYETILELEPSLIPKFVEKMNARLEQTNFDESLHSQRHLIGVIDGE